MLDLTIKPETPDCGGLFYRYRRNCFVNKYDVYSEYIKLIPLKRKSCKGCYVCHSTLEELREFPYDIDIPKNIQDGDMLELVWKDTSTYYESDAELIFRKVKK